MMFTRTLICLFLCFALSPCFAQPGGGGPPGGGEPVPLQGLAFLILGGIILGIRQLVAKNKSEK